jgi:hypothetical protein
LHTDDGVLIVAVGSLTSLRHVAWARIGSGRDAMLGWDFGLFVVIVWIAERVSVFARERMRLVPVAAGSELL